MDPTSKIMLKHYGTHYKPGTAEDLASLILNIVFVRNTMSKEIVKMCEEGKMPWLRVEHGRITEESKKAADDVFLSMSNVFFLNVETNERPE